MEELKRIGVFTKVVQAKSFSEAARRLGIAKSAVSKHIRLLEQEVGVRLINRSTRKLSLTEVGEVYYRHCQQIVDRAEIALNELRQYQDQPTGTLRISSPVAFGRAMLIPVIKELRSLYPSLNIDLELNDEVVNMVEEGIDLAVRVGQLKDSSLVARKLCDIPIVTFASPEYLAVNGTPQRPLDLIEHQWLALSFLPTPIVGQFKDKRTGEFVEHRINSGLKSNSIDAIIDAAAQGLGISALVKATVEEHLKAGRLVSVLNDYELEPRSVYAVYPHREHLPPKVRVFMEFLKKHCENASWVLDNKP
ncbi:MULTISPECIES: LysR family transcriptional regulator [Vibrio]|uniref:HTH lysR-type domain-containing protein n=1 Tax=Vibrio bivalvicida TaxID=1276888 RepID=A0A177Y2T9_9VIBR|nr:MULTISPECIES: LysR family transcriptional regulator [Vibrio]KLN63475.1 hypothetical protein ZX61_18250 [Vibrio sp. VPAP30]OAJ95199.1 hypothetical protein APB76_07915 [Vibrio bivalvicida]